jgi:Txe/YoeB family toxin of toxin-antitoxin system
VTYNITLSKKAEKDILKLKAAKLLDKTKKLLDEIAVNPTTYKAEKLIGDLNGCYSLRINIKHRLVYEVFEDKKAIQILRMWNHYE